MTCSGHKPTPVTNPHLPLVPQATELKLKVETAERERDFYFEKLRDIEILCQAPELQVRTGGAAGWRYAGPAAAAWGMCRELAAALWVANQRAYSPTRLQEIPAIRIVEKILYAADSGGWMPACRLGGWRAVPCCVLEAAWGLDRMLLGTHGRACTLTAELHGTRACENHAKSMVCRHTPTAACADPHAAVPLQPRPRRRWRRRSACTTPRWSSRWRRRRCPRSEGAMRTAVAA